MSHMVVHTKDSLWRCEDTEYARLHLPFTFLSISTGGCLMKCLAFIPVTPTSMRQIMCWRMSNLAPVIKVAGSRRVRSASHTFPKHDSSPSGSVINAPLSRPTENNVQWSVFQSHDNIKLTGQTKLEIRFHRPLLIHFRLLMRDSYKVC